MGLLDQILGGLTGRSPSSSQPGGGAMGPALAALLPIVMNMLASRQGGGASGGMGGLGGLGGLLERLTHSGYGQQASSWVGTGANEPVPDHAWSDVLGADRLSAIAAQAGLSEEQTKAGLSHLLPQVVDQLTPQGQMPADDQLLSSIDDFARRLGG